MNFNPSFILKNKHIQTVYATLFRKKIPIPYELHTLELSDGDELECYFYMTQKRDAPFAIVFHGLAGSYESPYTQGVMQELHKNDINSVLMHFRGCSGKPNKLPRSYHSGETHDARECIAFIQKHYKPSKLYGIGYSLGANMLLKLLGELGDISVFDKAVAISPPMKLDICANQMNKGFSRYYQHRLIKDLKKALLQKYEQFDMEKYLHVSKEDIKKIKTFWEFDDVYTAPIHGFDSAQDYYTKSSSFQFLKKIQTPTMIIHAKDDPFMTPDVIPTQKDISSFITLNILENGGHVGFVDGDLKKTHYWLEKAIVKFLQD